MENDNVTRGGAFHGAPGDNMPILIWSTVLKEKINTLSGEYDNLLDYTEHLVSLADIDPEHPALHNLDHAIEVVQDIIKENPIPEEVYNDPDKLWLFVQNNIKMLALTPIDNLAYAFYVAAWTYVYANIIGDW